MGTEAGQASFAVLLQRHRVAAGLSQEELAERAGLSRRGITDLERGARRSPHPSTIRRLAEALLLPDTERIDLMLAARPRSDAASRAVAEPTPGSVKTRVGSAEGELKQATALCCHLVHATGHGPDTVLDLLHELLDTATHKVAEYGGAISAVLGDGFIAVFGIPLAREDHARRAVLAALGIQRALTDPLQVRMGLHSGWLAVGRLGGPGDTWTAAAGELFAVASAIQRVAEPGSILIGEATARLVSGFFRLSSTGTNESGAIHRVTGVGPRRSPLEGLETRASSPFVGRASDLAILQELWARAEAGLGQVVGIVGEPGMGKSRLVHEFRRGLSGSRATYLEGRCVSYGATTPYLPIIQLVHANCGILDTDESDVAANKVRLGLQEVGLEPENHAGYMLHMLGLAAGAAAGTDLGPELVRTRTFETLLTWMVAGAQQRPVLVLIEDLHWIDSTSEEFLGILVDSIGRSAVLIICTWRPGYLPKWIRHSYATQLALKPLDANDSLSIVRSVANLPEVAEPLARGILERAEGNPFFLEELARAIDVERRHGEVLPDAIQGVLAARIDDLPTHPRRVLQTGSVIGREFSPRLLRAIIDEESLELATALRELERREFLYSHTAAGAAVLSFKHALTQEAAYASLTSKRRKRLHERIGRALLAEFSEIAETQPELLAHHFTEAGLTEVAITYWQTAGERAAERSANVEAISHLKRGLDLLAILPESSERARRELGLQIALGGPLIALAGYGAEETVKTYTRARTLADQLRDPAELFPLLFRRWVTHTIRSEEHEALSAAEEFSRLAEQQQDSGPRMMAHRLLGVTYFMLGELVKSQQEFSQALALHDPERHQAMAFRYGQDPKATILVWRGIGLWLMGKKQCAQDAIEEAMAVATDSGHMNTQAFALTYGRCLLETLRGNAATIEPYVRSLIELADTYRLTMWRAYATIFEGWMIGRRGDAGAGSVQIRNGLADMRSVGTEGLRPYLLGLLASTYVSAGEIEPALAAITEALELASTGGERWAEAELHRLRGEILRLSRGDRYPEVQSCFDLALAIARSQQAEWLECRILGRGQQRWQGPEVEARG